MLSAWLEKWTLLRLRSELGRALELNDYSRIYARFEELLAEARSRSQEPAPQLYEIGALALIGLGHIAQARELSEEFGQRSLFGADSLYLTAFLHFYQEHIDEAILAWSSIAEIDPKETHADWLLQWIGDESDEALDLLDEDPSAWRLFFPKLARRHIASRADSTAEVPGRRSVAAQLTAFAAPERRTILAAVALLIVASISLGIWLALRGATSGSSQESLRLDSELPLAPGVGAVVPSDSYARLGDSLPEQLYESRDDVLRDYDAARALIIEGHPNQARRLLSLIEISNASFEIKERASLLRSSIPLPDAPLQFADSIEPEALLAAPFLYRDAELLWRGQVERTFGAAAGGAAEAFTFRPFAAPQRLFHVRVRSDRLARGATLPGEGGELLLFARFDGLSDQGTPELELLAAPELR